jgi:hypothetical protein
MCEHGRAANLDRVLFLYRFHAGQTVLARYKQLCRDNRYAAYRAACRRRGEEEPSFQSYAANQSAATRWSQSVEAWSLLQYRTGRIKLANGDRFGGLARLVAAATCRPRSVMTTIRDVAIGLIGRACRHSGEA